MFNFRDVLTHPNAPDLLWGTLQLFVGSYFNMLIMTKIMKKYTVICMNLNSIMILGGVIYRFQPENRPLKMNIAMIY